MKKSIFSKITIILILVICGWYGSNLDTWGKNEIIKNDVISYYAYLPAAFIFDDLTFEFTKNIAPNSGVTIWVAEAPNGKLLPRMTMGMAILWMPFFTAAHTLAKLSGESTLGYSWPYSLSIFVATLFYLFVGMAFIRKLLLRYFPDWAIAVAILLIVLATNLMFYVISEPGMTHVYNFGLISAFIYYSVRWVESLSGTRAEKLKLSVILGFLAGIITLIRPVNVLVLVFPALIGISSVLDLKNRISGNWKLILAAGISALLILSPQLVFWKIQTGHFFFNSYMDQGKFYFLKPHIIEGLIGFRKGWLIYTPVMIGAMVGLVWLKKYVKPVYLPLIVFLIVNIYVVFSWWCWWYGGSFSSRPMIDMYGILSLPLTTFICKIMKSKLWHKLLVAVVFSGLIWLNQFQMSQYRTSLLHWDSMSFKAYIGIFGRKTWPEGYDKMIKIPDYEKALRGEKEY